MIDGLFGAAIAREDVRARDRHSVDDARARARTAFVPSASLARARASRNAAHTREPPPDCDAIMAGKSRKSTGATRPKSGSGTAKNRTGNMKHKSTTLAFGEATFDDAKRKEWVTGYHKRKTQRRKKAAKDIEDRARRERIAARKERRDAEKIALGLIDGPDDGDGGGDGDAGGDGGGADDGGVEKEKETTYGSGVTVTVMEGF